jgi:hypothetical protein
VLTGRVADRYGPRLPMIAGQLLALTGLLLLMSVGADTPPALVAAVMVPLGLGGAMTAPPLTAAAMDAVPADRAGPAAGGRRPQRRAPDRGRPERGGVRLAGRGPYALSDRDADESAAGGGDHGHHSDGSTCRAVRGA